MAATWSTVAIRIAEADLASFVAASRIEASA